MTFGVSGLLYKSNLLMYDHQTESLWLQVKREAVTGPMTGARLKTFPSAITTWAKWRQRHPDSQVLSPDTGYDRDYSQDPYDSYYQSSRGLFSFFKKEPGPEDKALIVGVERNGRFRAYPLELLRKKELIKDKLGGEELEVVLDKTTDTVALQTPDGEIQAPIVTYWFVWQGIHPDSDLFSEKKVGPRSED